MHQSRSLLNDIIAEMVREMDKEAALKRLRREISTEDYEEAHSELMKAADKLHMPKHEPRQPILQLHHIPTEFYQPILTEVLKMIRDGAYTQDVMAHLMIDYGLDYTMSAYFNNEALSIIRLKSITPDEFEFIGQKYIEQFMEIIGPEPQNASEPDAISLKK